MNSGKWWPNAESPPPASPAWAAIAKLAPTAREGARSGARKASSTAFGWCLRSPSGRPIGRLFDTNRREAWALAFNYLYRFAWMRPLWHDVPGSNRAAAKRGWKVVRVTCVISEDRP